MEIEKEVKRLQREKKNLERMLEELKRGREADAAAPERRRHTEASPARR